MSDQADPNYREPLPGEDIRNYRMFNPYTGVIITDRGDWQAIATIMLIDVFNVERTAWGDENSKRMLSLINKIVIGCRRSMPPQHPEDRITMKFLPEEYKAIVKFSQEHPRHEAQQPPREN